MNRKSQVKKGILALAIIACLVAVIGGTYSRYISQGTATTTAEIAKWSVKLNGTNMSTTPITKEVQLTYLSNKYVKDGTIAPGRKATFDIVIDPTDSEVAIDYTLIIDTSAITGLTNGNSNVSITKAQYKFGEGAVQSANITSADGVTISESLADVEAGKALTMTVTVEWDNEDDENNAADTANGVQGGTITIPVTVTAMQHI